MAAFLMSGIQWDSVEVATPAMPKSYSVRWLRLEATDLRPYVPLRPALKASSSGAKSLPATPKITSPVAKSAEPAPEALADPVTPPATPPAAAPVKTPKLARVFEPPVVKRPPADQTLIQLDVPPDLVPLPNVPLPTAVLWSQQNQKMPVVKVAAPPVPKMPRPVRNPPAQPTIDAPNAELVAANVQLSSSIINNQPSLAQLAAVTTPVRNPYDHGDQLPQTTLPPSNERIKSPNVVSLPDVPLLAKEAILIPPANQVAPASPTGGGSGSENRGNGGGSKADGDGGRPAGAAVPAPGSGPGSTPSGNATTGNAAPGNITPGKITAGNPATGTITKDPLLASLKRITLPKDGKFGAVVMGSSATGPYTEAQGALSGKILYTVYLRVGLKKNWIMQYGLPKALEQAAATRGGTPNLDAPWPFLLVTPHYSSLLDQEYIILRGTLNTAGKLEQLKLITPVNYGGRDLLVSTLEIWQFRPAKKDGEDTAVEVLLIIPRQEG